MAKPPSMRSVVRSGSAVPVIYPAGLVPEAVFRNERSCLSSRSPIYAPWPSQPAGFQTGTGPVAAQFRADAFSVGIDMAGRAVDRGDMPIGCLAVRAARWHDRCRYPLPAWQSTHCLSLRRCPHPSCHCRGRGSDVACRASAGMTGGTGQFGSARGAEMDIHGCRRIDHVRKRYRRVSRRRCRLLLHGISTRRWHYSAGARS